MRVLLLANVPTPYNLPVIDLVRRQSGWSLEVCFISRSNEAVGWADPDKALQGGGPVAILDARRPGLAGLFGVHLAATLELILRLLRFRPQYLILYGYTQLPQAAGLLWAAITGTPFAVMGDANIHADLARGARKWIKRIWLGGVCRRAAALISVGTTNRLFWESYGARPEKIFDLRYPVDNDYFARETAVRKAEAEQMREKLGLPGRAVFLFVGRLVARKNVDLLIRAAKSAGGTRAGVLIVGSGEERESLERLAAGDPRIVFAGIAGYGEMPLWYSMSDVLVLPARHEPWGLVINEAMASGLAVIAHRECGAAVDLVGPDNGVALEGFDEAELARAIERLAGDKELRESMQRASREKIKSWSVDAAARAIIHAVETSCQNKGSSVSRRDSFPERGL